MFFLSLEGCFEGQKNCSKKSQWIQKKLNEGLCCSFLLSLLFELMLQNLISKYHLIHVIIVFISFYIYSHGLEFYDHGLFNLLSLICLLIIVLCLFIPFNILLYIIKKRNKIILFIYSILLILLFFSFYNYLPQFIGCNDWKKGLNDTFLDNDINKNGCQIRFPKYCPYKFFKYLLDITYIGRIKCGFNSNAKQNLFQFSKTEYINEKTKKIGYPIINEYFLESYKSNKKIRIPNIVCKNLIDMENYEQIKNITKENMPEIIVDFSENDIGKMFIDLKFNESLSNERKLQEKKFHPYSNNIIILFFDSVSRVHGIRQLKKTLSFFERFMPLNSEKFHSFQFFKYHSFKYYTGGNYPKLFMDIYSEKEKRLMISYYLKKYGYITAFSNDICSVNPYSNLVKEFSKLELCDHEFLLCDPNKKHLNSMTKRCLYQKTNIDYQFEYGLQFWRKYKINRKFLMIVNNDGHESTMEVIKYDDGITFNFLNTLYQENLLDDTTILLLSDHGCSLPTVYYFNEFFELEKNLPMLYIMVSDKANKTYDQQYHHIHENQQKFITAYDIYNTICFLMLGKNYYIKQKAKSGYILKSQFGINLFEPINKKRTPKDYKSMEKNICI